MDILIFIIALSILVLVHEFGHFFAAIKTGVKVEEFGLGLPPKIFGKKIGETVFSFNLLPIGGFCRLYGEDSLGKGGRAFNNKNPWQKLLVVTGGVLMNLILAVVIFSFVYAILGVPKETNKVKIIGVAPNSPAEKIGLKEEDWVYQVADQKIENPAELTSEISKYKGKTADLIIKRNNEIDKKYTIEVRENPPQGEGSMGVAISNTEMVRIPWYRFYEGIAAGFKEAYFWGKIIFDGVTKMVGGLFAGQIPKDVSGPVGMFEATSSIKRNQGMLALIHFFGVVSVNLAIVNILPFPALDGGRILFVFYEMITKKRANPRIEAAINNFGMLVLLALIAIITISDVTRIINR